ncbi:hypothetical protein Bbelb_175470 [Branchiostoma belcheri]|nr:hypothetical protein Bbelb_175470 [Branchiostoma belcheri]
MPDWKIPQNSSEGWQTSIPTSQMERRQKNRQKPIKHVDGVSYRDVASDWHLPVTTQYDLREHASSRAPVLLSFPLSNGLTGSTTPRSAGMHNHANEHDDGHRSKTLHPPEITSNKERGIAC